MKTLKLICTFFVLGLSFTECSKFHQKQGENDTKANFTVDTVDTVESDRKHVKFNGATLGTSLDTFF